MRQLVLLIGVALATLNSLAQGVLNFSNKTNEVDAQVFGLGCNVPLGSGWVVQLYYGPSGSPECLLTPLGPSGIINTGQFLKRGYFNAGPITIDGFLPGQTIAAQIRVWSPTISPSWDEAVKVYQNNMIGVSSLFQVTLTAPTDPPANLTGLQSFCLYYPEQVAPYPSLSAQVVLTNILVFSWLANSGASNLGQDNFVLQQNSSLDSRNWVTLPNVPWTDWSSKQVAIPKPATTTFYRLVSQR